MKIYVEIIDNEKLEVSMKSGEFPFHRLFIERTANKGDKVFIETHDVTQSDLRYLKEYVKILKIIDSQSIYNEEWTK